MPILLSVLKIGFIVVLLSIKALTAEAAIDVYDFNTPEQEKRFQTLTEELRCPKCQNQTLADSNADIAKDLKARIYTLMSEGKSDEEITDYLVERYGDFVRYRPPVKPLTLLLWFGPLLLFLSTAFILLWRLRRMTKTPPEDAPTDATRLHDVIRQYSDHTPQ